MPAHSIIPSLNPDRTIYLVLCRYKSGMEWPSRPVDRTCYIATVEDIRSGELPDVVTVIELNVAEFSSRDVTEDILEEAFPERHAFALTAADRQANTFDHNRSYRNA